MISVESSFCLYVSDSPKSNFCQFITVTNIMALNPAIPSLQTAPAGLWRYGHKITFPVREWMHLFRPVGQGFEMKWGKRNE